MTYRESKPKPNDTFREAVDQLADSERTPKYSGIADFLTEYAFYIRSCLKFVFPVVPLVFLMQHGRSLVSEGGVAKGIVVEYLVVSGIAILVAPVVLLCISYIWMWGQDLAEKILR